jgi:hypothetical protein
MAAYLSLKNRKTGEIMSGENLIDLDAQICAAINHPVDKVQWCKNWMDTIGFALALGHDYSKVRAIFGGKPELLEILNWLEENYENTSYMGR